jgi:NitT/TauT family transport system permease protein
MPTEIEGSSTSGGTPVQTTPVASDSASSDDLESAETHTDARDASRLSSVVRKVGPPAVAFGVILLVWQIGLTVSETPSFLFPKPSDVFEAVRDRADLLAQSAWRTVSAAVTGLLMAIVGGIVAAVVLASSKVLERSLLPYAVLIQTTPIVAIAPIIVIWLGAGLHSIIVIVFIISFFPMLSNTLVGLNSVDAERSSLFRLYHASRWQTMRKLRLPAALPYVMAGAKISSGLSVIGAIVGEFVAGVGGGRGGLGYVITVSATQLDSPYLFAAALTGSLVGIVFYWLVGRASRIVLGSWQEVEVEAVDQPIARG